MHNLSVSHRRQIGLVLACLIVVVGNLWGYHDSFTLAALVLAVALIWSSREWKAWVIAATILASGLLWSSIDRRGCSVWWKGILVHKKISGQLAFVGWSDVRRKLLSPCVTAGDPDPAVASRIKLIDKKTVDGHPWERFDSELGRFWLEAPGEEMLAWLIWEMTVQQDYAYGDVSVRPGDTVIDCGAHVGVFTKYALRRGAGRVIAIEPDPTNLACLEANLPEEIAAGKVHVVKVGVWKEQGHLTLSHSDENPAGSSFVHKLAQGSDVEGIPVLPLDEIVEELKLDRVDFIKMDIEGSEREALQGARSTLTRFKPRMAICTYHIGDDTTVIPLVVKASNPDYQIHAKDIDALRRPWGVEFRTKVLFFH